MGISANQPGIHSFRGPRDSRVKSLGAKHKCENWLNLIGGGEAGSTQSTLQDVGTFKVIEPNLGLGIRPAPPEFARAIVWVHPYT